MSSIRFEMPAFCSGSYRTSVPESVTALFTFLRIVSGGSSISTVPLSDPRDLDIFTVGSCRFMTRPTVSGKTPSGMAKVSP